MYYKNNSTFIKGLINAKCEIYLKFGGTQKCCGTVVENHFPKETVCNLQPSIKVLAAAHIQLKIHNIAADAGVLHINAKQKKCESAFVDRMCKNLIREVWQKRNLFLKNDDIGQWSCSILSSR